MDEHGGCGKMGQVTHDKLSQEDFLVRVEGVDDQIKKLTDLGLSNIVKRVRIEGGI